MNKQTLGSYLADDSYRPSDAQLPGTSPLNWRLTMRSHAWRPPTDVFEVDDAIIVRVEIAGMRENDFIIELTGRSLSIRGTRQDAPERRAYHQMEIRFGEFIIDFELPYPVEAKRVFAVYENGFLRVRLPKAQEKHIPLTE